MKDYSLDSGSFVRLLLLYYYYMFDHDVPGLVKYFLPARMTGRSCAAPQSYFKEELAS